MKILRYVVATLLLLGAPAAHTQTQTPFFARYGLQLPDNSLVTGVGTTAGKVVAGPAFAAEVQRALAAEALLAPLATPAFTGIPTAPTPTPGTSTTQIGTTAFTAAAVAAEAAVARLAEQANATAAATALTKANAAFPASSAGTAAGKNVGTTTGTVADGSVDPIARGAVQSNGGPADATTLGGRPLALASVQSLPTMAALYAFPYGILPDKAMINLAGYSTPADGGGGLFVWSALSTATDDGGTVINPNAGTGAGRWLRYNIHNAVNVRWWGAGLGGDSTPPFRAAVSTGRSVYAPTGTYGLSDEIDLQAGQEFYGDGPTKTVINVFANHALNINLSAKGAFVIPSGSDGSRVHDLQFNYDQADVASRASIVTMPPAIYAQGSGRFRLDNIRVSGPATACLDMRNGGAGSWINNFECMALTVGINADQELDFTHIHGFHFWNFGLTTALYPNLNTVWRDGTTIAANLGHIDGLDASGWSIFQGQVNVLANATFVNFANLMLDSAGASLNVAGGQVDWTNGYGTGSTFSGSPQTGKVNVSGGTLLSANVWMTQAAGAATPAFVQTGGKAILANWQWTCQSLSVACGTNTGGFLTMNGFQVDPAGTGTYTVPLFSTGSLGVMEVSNGYIHNTTTPGAAFAFGNDSAYNSLNNVQLNGWSTTVPAGASLGRYSTSPYGIFTPFVDAKSILIGGYGLNALTTGTRNTGFGVGAFALITGSADSNIGIGYNALSTLTSGISNVAIGGGGKITTGGNNVIIGGGAGSNVTTTGEVMALGTQALTNATGAGNTGAGYQAGSSITGGSNNTVIGDRVGNSGMGAVSGNILLGTDSTTQLPTGCTSNCLNIQRGTISGTSQTTTTSVDAQIKIGGIIQYSVSAAFQASGTTQATATQLVRDLTLVTGGSGGVVLAANVGQRQEVFNRNASAINIYPPSGAGIESGTANSPVSLATGAHAVFECLTTTQCYQAP